MVAQLSSTLKPKVWCGAAGWSLWRVSTPMGLQSSRPRFRCFRPPSRESAWLVGALVSGDKDNQEISESRGIRQTGRVSGYLAELAAAGFTKHCGRIPS